MVTNASVKQNFSFLSEIFLRYPKGYYILLTLISLCFVAIKFAMPIIFDGSFIDEYLHSVGGDYFLKHSHLPKYYIDQASYNRGSYVTVLSSIFTHFFGRSVFSFKLVPITVGVINFFLLMFLAHKTLRKKSYVLLLLIIYSISPWVIFNHFYLRMYVFYELFLLINLTVAQLLVTFCEQNKKWHMFAGTLFLLFLCAAQLELSNDNGAYMPVLAGGAALAYIFICCSHLLQFKKNKTLSYIFHLNIYLKFFIIITAIAAAYFFDSSGHQKILFLFKGKLQYTSSEKFKYYSFFFQRNYLLTFFFLLSAISSFAFKAKKKQMIVIIGLILFSIHLCSSSDLQITRGLFYFLPLYYLISFLSIDNLKYFSDKIFNVVIYSVFIYSMILNYPSGYTKIPYIPTEIFYIDYSKLYSSVQQHCSDKTVVEASPSPFIASYYNVEVDYVLSETGWIKKEKTYYYNEKEKRFKTVFGETPVLSNFNALTKSNSGTCLIVRKPSRRRFVSKKTLRSLSRKQVPLKFINIELYISP